MKKILIFSLVCMMLVVGHVFTPSEVEAQNFEGTFKINGYSVNIKAFHKNAQGEYADGGTIDIYNVAKIYYSVALNSANNTLIRPGNISDCGNTTGYTIKVLSCPVANICDANGNVARRNANCSTTVLETCQYGCTNAKCNPGPQISCTGSTISMTSSEAKKNSQKVQWNAQASGGNGNYNYQWTFSDGSKSSSKAPKKLYSSSATQSASVTMTTSGKSFTASCTVGQAPVCPHGLNSDGSCAGAPGQCNEDVWQYGNWSQCINNTQTRSSEKIFDCPNVDTPSKPTSQYCNPGEAEAAPLGDISLNIRPLLVAQGQSCTIEWSSEGATGCTLSGPGVSETELNGEIKTPPLAETSTYKLTCTNGIETKTTSGLCKVIKNVQEF